MKLMPKNELITILKYEAEYISIGDINEIFEKYADDYFVVDGELDMTNENEARKKVLRIIEGQERMKFQKLTYIGEVEEMEVKNADSN